LIHLNNIAYPIPILCYKCQNDLTPSKTKINLNFIVSSYRSVNTQRNGYKN